MNEKERSLDSFDKLSQKITSSKIVEEQERLKNKYEEEKAALEQANLDLENKITKKNDEIFELQKTNKGLAKEKEDWKREAHASRKVYQETKQAKETTDFLSEFKKSQEKKGIK
jgi:hypothetical protein